MCPSRCEHLTPAINSHGVWLTRPNQEVSDSHRVKVEHLSAGQLSGAHLIEAEDRRVQAFPIGASTSLSPEHDDLSVGGRYDAWLHLLLRLGGLERHPCLAPLRPIAAEALGDAAIRQRRGPVKLDIRVTKSEHPLGVTALDCAKDLEHQFGVLFGVHGGPSFDRVRNSADVVDARSSAATHSSRIRHSSSSEYLTGLVPPRFLHSFKHCRWMRIL